MVLPNCDLPDALVRANGLREIVGSTPVVCSGKERLITMSMGVAVSGSDGKNELETLLNQADAGLYAAKEKGRNRTEHFTPPARKPRLGARAKAKEPRIKFVPRSLCRGMVSAAAVRTRRSIEVLQPHGI